jgi:hypothetical protein
MRCNLGNTRPYRSSWILPMKFRPFNWPFVSAARNYVSLEGLPIGQDNFGEDLEVQLKALENTKINYFGGPRAKRGL